MEAAIATVGRCRDTPREKDDGVASSGVEAPSSMGRLKRQRAGDGQGDGEAGVGQWKTQRILETHAAGADAEYLGDGRRLVQHPRAKHGLLIGRVDRPAMGTQCSIWATRLPLWIPAATALGMTVVSVTLGKVAHRTY